MNRDAMLGCTIKALKESNLNKDEIQKILNKIYINEEELTEEKAQSIFYEFPEE